MDRSNDLDQGQPILGESISIDYLQEQFTQATNYGSSEEANFKTKHLNEWVSSGDVWIKDADWMACGSDQVDLDPSSLTWYGGLDLASVSDFCCLVLVAELPDERLIAADSTGYLNLPGSGGWIVRIATSTRLDHRTSTSHQGT